MTSSYSIYIGSFVHCKKPDALEFLHDTAVIVDLDGRITHVGPAKEALESYPGVPPGAGVDIHRIEQGQFFFPGFIG